MRKTVFNGRKFRSFLDLPSRSSVGVPLSRMDASMTIAEKRKKLETTREALHLVKLDPMRTSLQQRSSW
ncbi:hypothetical protein L596_017043 [Steinernema carpocapsae]|uniref:Uncharacterized protein n=1 Tax=Steinernema carpocapsae TaxID=34508 RepID=A0A4U5N0J8_STECR|nr:hypothetical protein L596_017043 [Steinernema carpocapsae]